VVAQPKRRGEKLEGIAPEKGGVADGQLPEFSNMWEEKVRKKKTGGVRKAGLKNQQQQRRKKKKKKVKKTDCV